MALQAVTERSDPFRPVTGQNDKLMTALRQIFERILVPLYGSQEDALSKIALGKDRACYLLYENDSPVGIIAYKTVLSDEFAAFKIDRSIEIKSLFVVDSGNNSGRGLGSRLLDRIVQGVKGLALKPDSFHVTVSASKGESLNFFMGKGFRIRHTWEGKYKTNMIEYLLSCPAKTLDPEAAPPIIREIFTPPLPNSQPSVMPHPHALFRVTNVHWGDIHVLKLLADRTFITGSKDNSLMKWNERGERVCVVSEVELTESDEKDWITAACILNDEYWVSGERSGRISLWTTAGEYIKSLKPKMPKSDHVSHHFNRHRVTCLSPGTNQQKLSFFIGFPTMFDKFNVIEGRTASSTVVHNNDWVYCIHPLTDSRILTVTAGTLELWEMREKPQKEWERGKKPLLQETQKMYGQRPFISCLTPLQSSPQHFGLAIFGGGVKVYDLQQGKVVQQWREHERRIWALENVSPQLFATGGEDRTIKFWDIRSPQSVRTTAKHVGEVTALMKLADNLLVAGTCPPDTVRTNEGAQLLFYEMRK